MPGIQQRVDKEQYSLRMHTHTHNVYTSIHTHACMHARTHIRKHTHTLLMSSTRTHTHNPVLALNSLEHMHSQVCICTCLFTLAFKSMSILTVDNLPTSHASWRAVRPCLNSCDGDIFSSSTKRLTSLWSPVDAAINKQLAPDANSLQYTL